MQKYRCYPQVLRLAESLVRLPFAEERAYYYPEAQIRADQNRADFAERLTHFVFELLFPSIGLIGHKRIHNGPSSHTAIAIVYALFGHITMGTILKPSVLS